MKKIIICLIVLIIVFGLIGLIKGLKKAENIVWGGLCLLIGIEGLFNKKLSSKTGALVIRGPLAFFLSIFFIVGGIFFLLRLVFT